jgi:hypothetical protein
MRQQHAGIVHRIGLEVLEEQGLALEVLDQPEDQLVLSPAVPWCRSIMPSVLVRYSYPAMASFQCMAWPLPRLVSMTRQGLSILMDPAKAGIQHGQDACSLKVADKEAQAAPAGGSFTGSLDPTDPGLESTLSGKLSSVHRN